MKGCSAFPKAPTLVEPRHQIVSCHNRTLVGEVWFGLVSLFNGISTLFRLFNAKAILLEEQ